MLVNMTHQAPPTEIAEALRDWSHNATSRDPARRQHLAALQAMVSDSGRTAAEVEAACAAALRYVAKHDDIMCAPAPSIVVSAAARLAQRQAAERVGERARQARKRASLHQCAYCGGPLPAPAGNGRPRLYCCSAHRVAAHRARA